MPDRFSYPAYRLHRRNIQYWCKVLREDSAFLLYPEESAEATSNNWHPPSFEMTISLIELGFVDVDYHTRSEITTSLFEPRFSRRRCHISRSTFSKELLRQLSLLKPCPAEMFLSTLASARTALCGPASPGEASDSGGTVSWRLAFHLAGLQARSRGRCECFPDNEASVRATGSRPTKDQVPSGVSRSFNYSIGHQQMSGKSEGIGQRCWLKDRSVPPRRR